MKLLLKDDLMNVKGAVSRQSSLICLVFSSYSPLLSMKLNFSEEITCPGGVRHGPQRVMGKNITDVHFTLGTME